MKVSICIPHYNRIEFLLASLDQLSNQTHPDFEVVVSDDASTDQSESNIRSLTERFRFPLTYHRFETNQGYDRNLRMSLELASGEYCFILGNDDSLAHPDDLHHLVESLEKFDHPDVGFCNFFEASHPDKIKQRAQSDAVIGSGPNIALKYHKSFSFVAGLIFKKDAFTEVNSAVADGSIYCQIYLATRIIARGGRLFTLQRPMVIQDIQIEGKKANSYRDTLIRSEDDTRVVDAGLPQVVRATGMAFRDEGFQEKRFRVSILRRIYSQTYPFWLLDYRRNNAPLHARALVKGLNPRHLNRLPLSGSETLIVYPLYVIFTAIGLFTPVALFNLMEHRVYNWLKG